MWALLLALTSIITYYAGFGGFEHMASLSSDNQMRVLFWNIVTETVGVLAWIPSKCSVAWLILRIMGPYTFWRRSLLYFVMVTTLVFNLLAAIFTWVKCQPVATN